MTMSPFLLVRSEVPAITWSVPRNVDGRAGGTAAGEFTRRGLQNIDSANPFVLPCAEPDEKKHASAEDNDGGDRAAGDPDLGIAAADHVTSRRAQPQIALTTMENAS
jgi:hypothetical protein